LELLPIIEFDLVYLGPKFLAIEIVNVGTMASKNTQFSYYLEGMVPEKRSVQFPLLKINDSKIIFLQDNEGTTIATTDVFRDKDIKLKIFLTYQNVMDDKSFTKETIFDISQYIEESEKMSIALDKKPIKEIKETLERTSRATESLERSIKKIENEFYNKLNISRLTLQRQILHERIKSHVMDKMDIINLISMIDNLIIQLMDPYPDLRSKNIETLLDAVHHIDHDIYNDVWELLPSLKWVKVTKK